MKMLLWEKNCLKKLFQSITFFLFAFFILFSLVDFSTHFSEFKSSCDLHFFDLFFFYLLSFIKRCDILVSLAFLVASIQSLLEMNKKNQTVILRSNGATFFKILRPFFIGATIISLLMGLCFEYVFSKAVVFIEDFEDTFLGKNNHKESFVAKKITLTDGSIIFYKSHHPLTNFYYDVFMVTQDQLIYKIEKLSISKESYGLGVHLLKKKDQNKFSYLGFYDKKELFNLEIAPAFEDCNFDAMPFSFLIKNLQYLSTFSSNVKASLTTHLTYKISILFLSYLIIICSAPFCLIFSRKLPIFTIYAMSIFGMIAFFTLMDGAIIIGESQVIKGQWVIIAPYLLSLLIFGPKFIKCCNN